MSIDYDGISREQDKTVLRPREIFFSHLTRGEKFSFLRDIQTEVMDLWYNKRDQKDNVIKLNVGSGKTLVGLLLLQSSLNEKKGPALYVAPNNQLAAQVEDEAKAVGISVVTNPREPQYTSGESICIVNVDKLFNGKSIFGIDRVELQIGTVVIDDAHACVSAINNQFRIQLKNGEEPYKKLLSIFSESLEAYNEARFLQIKDGDPQSYMEVPFWSWSAHLSDVRKVLHMHSGDENIMFSYPLLSEILNQCRCVISGHSLEIEPHFPALDIIQSFRKAKRRIYMSATMSDDSVTVTHFGIDPNNIPEPIVPNSSEYMGERMILMPEEMNPSILLTDIQAMLIDLAKQYNVVVIVASQMIAEKYWGSTGAKILVGDAVPQGIENLQSQKNGLTVLVNRYDGIDLPDNACRVLMIAGLPEIISHIERVDSSILEGSNINLKQQLERIEQGMGRGIRSNNDYCCVLLWGKKLVSRIRDSKSQQILTPATLTQLELSRKVAKKLNSPAAGEIKMVMLDCLTRNQGWVKLSKEELVGISATSGSNTDSVKISARVAFDLARSDNFPGAIASIQKEIERTTDEQVKSWLLVRMASLQHNVDATAAQATLRKAHDIDRNVMKPLSGAYYKKLSSNAGEQAAQLLQNHTQRFMEHVDREMHLESLCEDLCFSKGTSKQFEAAIDNLAWFLGIASERPEQIYDAGPDNLWALSSGEFLVIECKNEVDPENKIKKEYVGQLNQSVEWFKNRYLNDSYTPIMIHPKRSLTSNATASPDMRVIDSKLLEKLRRNLRDFTKQLANPAVANNTTEIAKRLEQFEFNGKHFVNAFSSPPNESKSRP